MRGFSLLFGFNILFLVSFLGGANNNINEAAKSEHKSKLYIVYMGAVARQNNAGLSHHAQLLSELMKRKENVVVRTYNKSFSGFAARLSDKEAKSIALRPGVVSVFRDQVFKLQTTRSWDFSRSRRALTSIDSTPLSSSSRVSSPTGAADTIIGVIDYGIWPEHPSFGDKFMGPIPSRWKGECASGQNSTYSFECNKKVIGARYYDDPEEPGYIVSARDEYGHGTFVASIAAGSPVLGASYYGLAKGTAIGISPRSRIAVYRVCAPDGCVGSSILKAYDDAIADGVDVISISISGEPGERMAFDTNPILIGAFHAAENNVLVVSSAGNRGPSPGTVDKDVPWIVTVAATTTDRNFETAIVLGPKNDMIKGVGINFSGLNKSAIYPLMDGRSSASSSQTDVLNASKCVPGSLDDRKVKGKIVICENDDGDFYGVFDKYETLKGQGAIGMIVMDNYLSQVPVDYGTYAIAAVHKRDGAQILSYINSTSNPLATILPTTTTLNYKPAPVVAYFSSTGPGIKNLLKPDIAAPGVGILAAWPPFNDSSRAFPGKEPPLFRIISGTSQACPHVSGLAATVKSIHPTWSPSAITSAIMTTAIQNNNVGAPITTYNGSRATPYDIGAGEISLYGSLCPGLVYETNTTDYLHFLCNLGYDTSVIKTISSTVPDNFACHPSNSTADLISDMNYHSIAISGLKENGMRTVKRTVTNVGDTYSTYTATLKTPAGMKVRVVPKILRFTKNVQKLSFELTFIRTATSKRTLFGTITWSNRKYMVQSPFVVSNA